MPGVEVGPFTFEETAVSAQTLQLYLRLSPDQRRLHIKDKTGI